MKSILYLLTLMLCFSNLKAQSGAITGTIKNNQNQPLENVNVTVLGTSKGSKSGK